MARDPRMEFLVILKSDCTWLKAKVAVVLSPLVWMPLVRSVMLDMIAFVSGGLIKKWQ